MLQIFSYTLLVKLFTFLRPIISHSMGVSSLLWLHSYVLFGLFFEVKLFEGHEDFVEEPDGIHPPGPAHPDYSKWNCNWQEKELRKKVQSSFKLVHVDELEVAEA